MSNELRAASLTGRTLYCHIVDKDGNLWNTSTLAFESYSSANWANYVVALTEQGTTGVYVANFPTDISDGSYSYYIYNQAGGSPVEGDIIAGTGRVVWNNEATVASTYSDVSDELRAVTLTGKTVYVHIMNSSGQRWNGSSFEDFSDTNYSNYVVALTEQGSSGLYLASFPSGIGSGVYEYFAYRQLGGAAATGDPIINTGKVIWNGSEVVQQDVQGMSAIAFRNYIVRTFKREDKNTELYEAVTDTVQEMRMRYNFAEDETETQTTIEITTLGEYKIPLENNIGLIVSEVVLLDDDSSEQLIAISKSEYDRLYPNPSFSNVTRGRPKHYCIYGGYIWLGDVPDSVDYKYKISFSIEPCQTIDADTPSIPFTKNYRETVKFGTLARLFEGVDNEAKADRYYQLFEVGFAKAKGREMNLKDYQGAVHYRGF